MNNGSPGWCRRTPRACAGAARERAAWRARTIRSPPGRARSCDEDDHARLLRQLEAALRTLAGDLAVADQPGADAGDLARHRRLLDHGGRDRLSPAAASSDHVLLAEAALPV